MNLWKVSFGLKAGLNISNLYDTKGEEFDSESKLGLAFGGFLSLPLGKYIGFQPEVMYSQKGFTGTGSVLTVDYEYKRNTDYIDVPLQLQIKPVPVVTILVGPQYSFLINKGFDLKSGSLSVDQQNDIENNNIRKNILGAVAGLDINFSNLVVSGRLSWDLQHNDGEGNAVSPRYKNTVAQIAIGLRF
ncbi:MAG: PorT family protein [Bacteroidales bacterium]|nr:PorT family protein [Bacteroidales bacterium]